MNSRYIDMTLDEIYTNVYIGYVISEMVWNGYEDRLCKELIKDLQKLQSKKEADEFLKQYPYKNPTAGRISWDSVNNTIRV